MKTTDVIEQSYLTGGSGYTVNYEKALAQTFYPSVNCFLTKLELLLTGGGDTGKTAQVRLKAYSGTSPPDSDLATVEVLGIPAYGGWITADISDIALTANTTYWVYIDTATSAANTIYWIHDIDAATYTRGSSWDGLSGIDSDGDHYFKAYEKHYRPSGWLVSQIHDTGSSSMKFSTFQDVHTKPAGTTMNYFVRTDTAAVFSSPSAWVAVTTGTICSATFEQFVQWRATMTATNVLTPRVDSVIMNFVPNVGFVYKQDVGDNDDGDAIESFWQTKDYDLGNSYKNKTLRKMKVLAKRVGDYNLTLRYNVDFVGGNSNEYNINLNQEPIVANDRGIPSTVMGKFFNFKVSNNNADEYWELYGLSPSYTLSPGWSEP